MKLLRFERKILGAILLAGAGPLIAALWIGSQVLDDTYRIGVNEDVHSQLIQGVEARREQILSLRNQANLIATLLCEEEAFLAAPETPAVERARDIAQRYLDEYEKLESIQILYEEEPVLQVGTPSGEQSETRPLSIRETHHSDSRFVLSLSFAAPESVFAEYAAAGQFEESYRQLLSASERISTLFFVVYLAGLGATIAIMILLASLISRRVTRRVVTLREATKEVAAGNLGVRVPVRSNDEIAELTEAFNLMLNEVESSRQRIVYLQQISAWQEFARRLAHEIKNPLTPIQLAIQDVSESYQGEDPAHRRHLSEARSIIEEEVQALRILVSEFSEFARLPQANRQTMSLKELLQSVGNAIPGLLADIPGAKAYKVVIDDIQAGSTLQADASMLRRALLNLIQNAAQALQGAKRQDGQILVRCFEEDHSIKFEVEDDGPGITQQNPELIFEPYVTTKEMGSGLGLAIVKKIVFEHYGQVTSSKSRLGGAKFSIMIPQTPPKIQNQAPAPSSPK